MNDEDQSLLAIVRVNHDFTGLMYLKGVGRRKMRIPRNSVMAVAVYKTTKLR